MKRPSFLWMSPAITKIGNRFHVDAHYFAKNTAIVTLAHSISVLKGIITGYLVTRLFPQELYGEYRFALSVIGIVGFIGLPGISSALAKVIARKEPFSLVRVAQWYSAFSLLGSLVLLGCIPFLAQWGRQDLWPLFIIGALVFTPNVVGTNIFGGIIRGTGSFTTAFRANVIANATIVVATLLMLFLHPSSTLLLLITSGIPALVYLSYLPKYFKKFTTHTTPDPVFKPTIQLSLATIPTSLSWYVDGLLISAFFGLNQLAVLSVALLIPEQVKVWTKELFPILFSKQAQGKDTASRRKMMDRAVLIGFGIFAIGIGIYALLAPLLMPILFPKYDAAALVPLTIVSAITLLAAPFSVYTQFLEARGMIRAVHISNWVSSGIFAIALVILVPTYGPMGAVISRGIFRFSNSLSAWVLVRRTPTEA